MGTNPYIHKGARVRVVDNKAAPCFLVIGEEHTVQAVSNSGKYVDAGGWGWLHVSRFKPVVRVKARCRPLGPGVHDDARPGDIVYRADWTRYARVYETVGMLRLSPWWAA